MKILAPLFGTCLTLAFAISAGASPALLLRYSFDEADSGTDPTADLGEVEPLVDGRFFGDATRTGNTPGGYSTGALDVTVDGSSVIANHDHPDVASLDGKLDNLTQFTVTLWVNLQEDPNHLDRIFKAGNTNGIGYRIVDPDDGEISASNFGFALDITDGNVAFGGADLDADDKWIFIAVSFDGNAFDEMVQLYVGDESLPVERRSTANSLVTNMGALDAPLRLGRHPNLSHRQINGFIDDFRVYEGVADAEMIEAIRMENLPSGDEPDGYAAWLEEFFTPGEIDNGALTGPEADPDGDGVSNLLEYALGGDPTQPDRGVLPVQGIQTIDGADYLSLAFTRPEGIDDVVYAVESSSDLINWSPETELVDSVSEDGEIIETHRDTFPLDQEERRFLRLRITIN